MKSLPGYESNVAQTHDCADSNIEYFDLVDAEAKRSLPDLITSLKESRTQDERDLASEAILAKDDVPEEEFNRLLPEIHAAMRRAFPCRKTQSQHSPPKHCSTNVTVRPRSRQRSSRGRQTGPARGSRRSASSGQSSGGGDSGDGPSDGDGADGEPPPKNKYSRTQLTPAQSV